MNRIGNIRVGSVAMMLAWFCQASAALTIADELQDLEQDVACNGINLQTGVPAEQTGGSWPQWRGPNRDNISPEKGLLKEWPEDQILSRLFA